MGGSTTTVPSSVVSTRQRSVPYFLFFLKQQQINLYFLVFLWGLWFLFGWFWGGVFFSGQALIFQPSDMGIKAYVEPKGHWQLMQQKQRNLGACTFKTQAVHYGGCFSFCLSSLCFIVDTIIPFRALKKGGKHGTE